MSVLYCSVVYCIELFCLVVHCIVSYVVLYRGGLYYILLNFSVGSVAC